MKSLYITSSADFAGKNLLLVGLGEQMKKDGYQISFFKPLGNKPIREDRIITDEDIVFFHRNLGLPLKSQLNCPVLVTDSVVEKSLSKKYGATSKKDLHRRVQQSYNALAKANEMVLIKGLGRFYRGGIFGLTEISLIKEFNWPTIIIDKFASLAETVDGFIGAKEVLGNLLIGVVFNSVPLAKVNTIKSSAIPYLKDEGVDVLGIIPEDRALDAVSIREIRDTLKGELIAGKNQLEERVERFCMGITNVETALPVFRKEKCKAVITSGDRSDIQLAALGTPLKGLILTDRLYPSDIILSQAEELKVPVLVVPDDALRTMQKLEALSKHIGLSTPSKVKESIRVIADHVNISKIYKIIKG